MSPNDAHRRTEIVGIGLAVTAGASFGTLAIFGKLAYEEGADPLPLLAVRFAITSGLLVLFHVLTKRPLRVPARSAINLLLLGALGYGLEASLFFYALDFAPAGITSLIFFSYPLWTTLIALATKLERFNPRLFAALALGAGGVGTIFSIEATDPKGPLLALAAALVVAIYYLMAQVLARDVEATAAATWTALGATIALGAAFVVTRSRVPMGALGPASALGLATAISFVAMYGAIRRLGSARVAIASMMEPVTTLVLAATFLDERITLRVAFGAVLVVAALPILVARPEKGPAPMAPDTA